MNEPDGTITHRIQIIPLPNGTKAWCVWDDGQISEAVTAVAIAQRVNDVALHVEVTRRGSDERLRLEDAFEASADHDREIDAHSRLSFEWESCWVLILWSNFGEWDSPWVEQKHVFFDVDVASRVATEVKQEYERKHLEREPQQAVSR